MLALILTVGAGCLIAHLLARTAGLEERVKNMETDFLLGRSLQRIIDEEEKKQ